MGTIKGWARDVITQMQELTPTALAVVVLGGYVFLLVALATAGGMQ